MKYILIKETCLTGNPYKITIEKGHANFISANSVKYNPFTSCVASHPTSWSAAAFVFTFVTVLVFWVAFYFFGQRPKLNTGKQIKWERVVWIIFQTTGSRTRHGLPCVILICRKSMIHQELKLSTFSLPPHPKWCIFFNCDMLLILAWWQKEKSKRNWLMDSIRNAMHS